MNGIDLTGDIAVVTGASRGIGKGILQSLAAAGATAVGLARNEDALQSVIRDIEEQGGKGKALCCDVSDASQVKSTMDAVFEEFGKVDVLVNNAGITRDTLLLRMTEEDWDQVLQVNLKSMFLMTKAASRKMLKARRGSIINVTSVVGLYGNAGQSNYAASKAGIIGFTKSIAKEFGSRGIRCNAIAPGFIETDMTEGLSEDMRVEVAKRIPLGRLGQCEDIASAAMFFASHLSLYITGQVLEVSGGMGDL